MKKFSRCALILIIVTLLGAIGGYVFESSTTTPVYSSTARIIVTPGEKNEASVRATDGGLVKDFEVVFASDTVISAAQKTAGTSEDIAQYLTVSTVPNSNIVELTVTNPDQSTAKSYVDAVAKNVSKTASIVSVDSIQVLEYGEESNVSFKPDVVKNAAIIAAIVAAICLAVELIIVFVLNAFKDEDDSDNELAYERRYGNMLPAGYVLAYNKEAYEHAGISSADDGDELDDDEDEKFNTAIGADIYKEEFGKSDEDSKKKKKDKKKKAKKVKEVEQPVYDDDDEELDADEDIADESVDEDDGIEEEPVVDNVVAFGGNHAQDEEAEAEDDELDDYDDEEDIEDDVEDDEPNVASVASFEAAAAKEPETQEEPEKPAKAEKKSMRSSTEVLGTIKK